MWLASPRFHDFSEDERFGDGRPCFHDFSEDENYLEGLCENRLHRRPYEIDCDFDRSFGFDDGLSEKCIKELSIQQARAMSTKSCTLEDKLLDITMIRWTVREKLQLPSLVRALILDFYPTVRSELLQLRGRKLLGLHNGHDYYFKSMAKQTAGDLMCQQGHNSKMLSVSDHCASLGCPISQFARVIKAVRCYEDLDLPEEVSVLPSEFAVLVPANSSPSGSLRDMFESAEDWFDDANLLDGEEESEEELEMEGSQIESEASEVESLYHVSMPAQKRRKVEAVFKQLGTAVIHSRQILPQDRHLHVAATYPRADSMWATCSEATACEGVGVATVRRLLCEGAHPTAEFEGFRKASLSALCEAQEKMAELKAHIDGVLTGQFCYHQALFHGYLFCSKEEVREYAKSFLLDLELYKESVAVLRAASDVWAGAVPSSRTICSGAILVGRGVVVPDFEVLHAQVAAVPAAKQVPDVEVEKLAEGMQQLAESRVAAEKCSKLCCRVAEIDAMEREERPLQEARAKEKARLAKEKARLAKEARALEATRAREALVLLIRAGKATPAGTSQMELTWCNACQVKLPISEFSQNQLRKGHSRRCALCIAQNKPVVLQLANHIARSTSFSMGLGQLPGTWTEHSPGFVQVHGMGERVSPWLTFDACSGAWKFPPGLMQFLRDAGFQKPTTLQAYAWPSLMQGKDMIAITASGQGKSLSYLLPSYIKLKRAESEGRLRRNGIATLVIVATRERSQQILSESDRFGRPADITTACVCGDALAMFAHPSPQCLVATPNQLKVIQRSIDLSGCIYLVLDKLDQMLELDFASPVLQFCRTLPPIRQTVVYAASWSGNLQSVATQVTKAALRIQVDSFRGGPPDGIRS